MKAKPGQQPKMVLYSLKWKQGFATTHLMSHINSKHHADLERISGSGAVAAAGTSNNSRLFLVQRKISNERQNAIARDLVRHMVIEDKEPFSIVERPGFQKLVNTPCPDYRLPHRKQVTEVADEIADECLIDVKARLTEHIQNGGTVCLAADAWTKKRRS
jgi:hypothetical protein